jgi:hypothetical protein
MSIVLLGSTSGSCTLQEQAVAGTSVLTLPVGSGTVVANNVNSAIVSGTAVASTSGTSIDFTGIPSWAKKITVMFSEVSTSGTSITQIQLGDSGGIETSGYVGGTSRVDGVIAYGSYSTGYLMTNQQAAASAYSGSWVLTKIDGNTWVENHMLTEVGDATNIGGGTKTLSDTLTQVRITMVNGTDTFDAGSINILYE